MCSLRKSVTLCYFFSFAHWENFFLFFGAHSSALICALTGALHCAHGKTTNFTKLFAKINSGVCHEKK